MNMQQTDSDVQDNGPASGRHRPAHTPPGTTPTAPPATALDATSVPDAATITAAIPVAASVPDAASVTDAADMAGHSITATLRPRTTPQALSHPPRSVMNMQPTTSDLQDNGPAPCPQRTAHTPPETTPAARPAGVLGAVTITAADMAGHSATATPGPRPAPQALSHPPRSVMDMQQTDSDLQDNGPASGRHRTAHTPPRTTPTAPASGVPGAAADGVLGGRVDGDSSAKPDAGGQLPAGGVAWLPVDALGVLEGDPAALDADALGVFMRAVRSVRSWVDAREAAALRAAVHSDAAREAGASDAAAWLGRHTGVGRREALARERTATGLAELPEASEALAKGRLTLGHAQVLTQFAAPAGVDLDVAPGVDFPDPARDAARCVAAAVRERPDELIAAAETMSVDAYRRFLRRWADRAAGDDGAGRDIAQRRRRRVTVFETDDGMRGVRGLLPADQFAFFENELRRLAEARWRADHPDADNVPAKELTCPQRNADALVDMAQRSRQLGDNNDEPLGSHIDVMVLIDQETLTAGLHEASRCELDDNTPISPTAARRLLCGANILTAADVRKPWNLNLGLSRRAANRKIRKALIARDRTCTADGCDRPHWMCEIHHIIPWAKGGRTDLNNLTLLCSRHHHLHHAAESRRTNCSITSKSANAPPDQPPEPADGAPTISRCPAPPGDCASNRHMLRRR